MSNFPDYFDPSEFFAKGYELPVSNVDKAANKPSKNPIHPEMKENYSLDKNNMSNHNNHGNYDIGLHQYNQQLQAELNRQKDIHLQELEKIRLTHQQHVKRLQAEANAERLAMKATRELSTGNYLLTDMGPDVANYANHNYPNNFEPIVSPYSQTAEEVKRDIDLYDSMNQAGFEARASVFTGKSPANRKSASDYFNTGNPGDEYWANAFSASSRLTTQGIQKRNFSSVNNDSDLVNPTGL